VDVSRFASAGRWDRIQLRQCWIWPHRLPKTVIPTGAARFSLPRL